MPVVYSGQVCGFFFFLMASVFSVKEGGRSSSKIEDGRESIRGLRKMDKVLHGSLGEQETHTVAWQR